MKKNRLHNKKMGDGISDRHRSQLKVWLINLSGANARRAKMAVQLDQLDLEYEIYHAIDGKSRADEFMPQVDKVQYERLMGQRLLPGKIGCYFSHVAVWELLSRSDAKYGLIIEDDIVFHDDFLTALDTALEGAQHWDLLRLNATRAKLGVGQGQLGPYRLTAYLGRFTGNGCYLVQRSTAKRVLPDLKAMKLAFEHEIGQFYIHNYRMFGLEPFPSHCDDGGESQITGTNNSDLVKIANTKRLGHFAFKAANYVRRLIFLGRKGHLPGRSHQLLEGRRDGNES